MRQILAIGVVLAACAVHGSSCLAGVAYSNQVESSTAWNGFGSDFSPYWTGQTTVVKRTEENQKALDDLFCGSSGTWGLMFNCMDNEAWSLYAQRWTVNKISSSAHAETDVDTQFLLGKEHYAASSGDLTSNTDSNTANFANYAEIITYDNRVLANASAIAFQNAHFDGQSFGASGKVSAATVLKNASASAESSAKGSSCFKTTYRLEKDTPFSLSLDLASVADVDLAFSASDDLTGKTLWSLTPSQSNELRHLEWSGVLGAGQYSFALDALTDSLIDQNGVQKLGGQALYDISLDFDAESYQVPRVIFIDAAQYPLDSTDSLIVSKGDGMVMDGRCIVLPGPGLGLTAIPEPNSFVLLLAGFFSYVAIRWGRR